MTLERWIAAAVAIILVSLLLRAVRRRRLAGEPALDTITLFLAVWAISLGLFAVPVIDYTTTGAGTWVVIYGSLLAFLSGAWIARAAKGGNDNVNRVARPEQLSAARIHWTWLATGALTLLGFAFFVRAIDTTVGWETLIEDPSAARFAQNEPAFDDAYGVGKALSYFAPISLLVWTIALRARMFKGRWRFLAAAEAVVLIPYFLIGERLSLMTAFAFIIAFHLVWKPIDNPRRLIPGAAILLLAGLSYFYLIGSQKDQTIDSHPEIQGSLTSDIFEPVALPYLYWTANFPVFGELVEDPIAPTTYGQLAVLPAAKVAYRVLPVDGAAPEFGAFYLIPFDSYNSATWLGPFYRDFGALGCVLLPALIGFLATWALIEARRRRTVLSAWAAAIGLSMIVFSPLKSQLSDAITWQLLVLAPVVSVFIGPHPAARMRELLARVTGKLALTRRTVALLAAAIGVAGVVLVVLGLGSASSVAGEAKSRASAVGQLSEDGEKVLKVYEHQGPSTTSALTSQLQASNPRAFYEELPSPKGVPTTTGAIGVYADDAGFRLRSVTLEGEALEAVGTRAADGYQLFKPRSEIEDSVPVNGDFEELFEPPWRGGSETGVRVTQSSPGRSGAYALRIELARKGTEPPSTIAQLVEDLPRGKAGTPYTMREFVTTEGLSAQVVAGFQFVYFDGTTQYVPATVGLEPASTRRSATGIPAGTSAGWQTLTASAVAAKPVSAINVLAADLGQGALRGTILIDDVELTASTP